MTAVYDYERPFRERAAVSLADPKLRASVAEGVDRAATGRLRVLGQLDDSDELRDLAAAIRDAALSRLDEHLDRLADRWEGFGGKVFFAANEEEATGYVVELARRAGVRKVVKSKSMVSEEIHFNAALEEAGAQVVETDLGEYIIQLAGEHPSHIVAPAIHKSKAEVAQLFARMEGSDMPEDSQRLMQYARGKLRAEFLGADLGMTGVNFAVSETGALCTVTNEGNARMCATLPRIHVAVMGMERVVGTFDELAVMLALLGRSGTAQKLTQYTTLLYGPRRASEQDGPEESHLVIVDNGRSNVLGTRYQSALRCIRCGACLNVCPVYRQTGGHAYDPVYSGPIGAVITPLLRGTKEVGELAHASTLCGACTEACPVRIPLDDHLLHLRQDHAAKNAPVTEKALYEGWSHAWATARRYRAFTGVGRALGWVTRGRPLARLPLPVLGRWTKGRHFPGFPLSGKKR